MYLFEEGKARFVEIETGLSGELMVEVKKGLKDGQEIVTGPFKTLRSIKDGDLVKPMPEKKKKELEAEGKGASS